jgi:hypothetical protein
MTVFICSAISRFISLVCLDHTAFGCRARVRRLRAVLGDGRHGWQPGLAVVGNVEAAASEDDSHRVDQAVYFAAALWTDAYRIFRDGLPAFEPQALQMCMLLPPISLQM